ncbi:MAG: hypothetical protein V2A54_02985 [Bacteroidota bacterium]
MKFFLSTLLFLTGLPFIASAQINQLDEGGKKHGPWKMYLDEIWKETEDTSSAKYIRYTVYDHGTNLYPMGPCGKKDWKLEVFKPSKSKILDGDYEWKKSNGQISSKHSFKNGEYVYCKEYTNMGNMNQEFDYTKKYKNEPNTWCVTRYLSNGTSKFYIWRKGDNYWNLYPGSEDDMKLPEKK